MKLEYTPWPETLANQYRQAGYWQDKPLTSLITEQLKNNANGIAVVDDKQTLTYEQLNRYSDNLAANLAEQGLKVGDTAVIQLANQVEFYISFFALLKLGVAPVCALFSHKQTELSSYCQILQPKLVIASSQHPLFQNENFALKLTQISPQLNTILIDDVCECSTLRKAYLTPQNFTTIELEASDVAFFQLSGGSTGTPKLIPRTHNDYLYSVVASRDICQLNGDHKFLCALPAPHNFALSSPGGLGFFAAGATVILASDPSPTVCLPLIEKYQITHSALVPPALQLWLQHANNSGHDISSLQVIQVGGSKLSLSVAEKVKPILACQLQQVFGMAEGLVNYTRYDDDQWLILNTQGRPISAADEIKVVDENGIEVPTGEEGRLMTRGPYTFRGYYKSPQHNLEAFTEDGFYSSGDLVKQLKSGHLIVTGRVKDQINRGGEKIAAEEVENILLRHPNVKQAAIVSMPDEILGEKSCAYIVGVEIKAITLRKYLRSQGIADYKVPDKFQFVSDLPLTPVGKVDKKTLRLQNRFTKS